MENLKSIQDSTLVERLKAAVHAERRITIEVLEYLNEIECRRIHAERGYSSLHEFCVSELRYSDGSTYRRISSMKLMRDLHELRGYLQNGKVSLSNAARLYRFFRHEERRGRKYSLKERRELLYSIIGKSVRECELILMALSPEPIPSESERILTTDQTEIRFVASDDLLIKLSKVKSLFAYRKATFGYADLFEAMAESILAKLDPIQRYGSDADIRPSKNSTDVAIHPVPASDEQAAASAEKLTSMKLGKSHRSYISNAIRREVWRRCYGRCAFIDPLTKRRCSSRFGLQIDHIIPFALGGSSDANNLRLLCRIHNQLTALHTFGVEMMSRYVSGIR